MALVRPPPTGPATTLGVAAPLPTLIASAPDTHLEGHHPMTQLHITPWLAGIRRAAARVGGVAVKPVSADRRACPGLVGH
jgi:hypothetical protein